MPTVIVEPRRFRNSYSRAVECLPSSSFEMWTVAEPSSFRSKSENCATVISRGVRSTPEIRTLACRRKYPADPAEATTSEPVPLGACGRLHLDVLQEPFLGRGAISGNTL